MTTLIVKLGDRSNQTRLIEAIKMFKGIKRVSIFNTEDEIIAKQISSSRKSGKGDKEKVLRFLNT